MKRIWDRIHVWLAANAPEVLQSLRPGVSEEDVNAAEAVLGVTLPDDVRAAYRIHDGQNPTPGRERPLDFLDGEAWNSLQAVSQARRTQAEHAERGEHVAGEGSTSEWLVMPRYHPRWVPLLQGPLHGGIAYQGSDLDASPIGGIILWHSDYDLRVVVAFSFTDLLTRFVEELESGRWQHVPGQGLAKQLPIG